MVGTGFKPVPANDWARPYRTWKPQPRLILVTELRIPALFAGTLDGL